jgi:hypothetical protein
MTSLETIKTTLVSAFFRRFGSHFGNFNIAGLEILTLQDKQNIHNLSVNI